MRKIDIRYLWIIRKYFISVKYNSYSCFGIHELFLFLSVQKMAPPIYSYSYLRENLLFADHCSIRKPKYIATLTWIRLFLLLLLFIPLLVLLHEGLGRLHPVLPIGIFKLGLKNLGLIVLFFRTFCSKSDLFRPIFGSNRTFMCKFPYFAKCGKTL